MLTNWKTSLVGILVGAMYIVANAYQPGMSLKTWAIGAGIAIWGLVMKDFNVTGGTTPATVEAESRTTAAAAAPVKK